MISAVVQGVSLTRFDDGVVDVYPEAEKRLRQELQKTQQWAVSEDSEQGIERKYVDVEPGTADHFRAVVLKLDGVITIDDGD
jgi:hypothetical protein